MPFDSKFSTQIGLVGLSILFICPMQFALAQYEGATPPPGKWAKGFYSITAEQCEDWLSVLAGPEFEGRGTGQPGHVKAAHWVAGKCAEFGLKPVGDADTFFQMLPISKLFVDAEKSKISVGEDLSIGFEEAVSLDRFTSDPVVQGKVAFVRISGAEAAFEDRQQLRDKIVILTVDESAKSRVTQLLFRQRPIAILEVTEDLPESSTQLKRENSRRRSRSTSGFITATAAGSLLEAVGGEAAWLSPAEENKATVHETEADCKIELRVYEEPTAVPNVVAWLPGADESVNDEYLVIGAHLDHLGVRGDTYYPGADDNGSGSTAILNIAKAISENSVPPKRSILFIWFAAEEIGLVGSAHYVANPTLPLDKMIGMLNIDMVGRNEEKGNEAASENIQSLHLVGSQKGDPAFHELILESNKHVNLTFEFDEENVFGRSDQINFFRKGASVAFLFGGFHPDYHRPSDKPEKINYEKIAAAAKLFYLAALGATDHGAYPIPEEEAAEEKDSE